MKGLADRRAHDLLYRLGRGFSPGHLVHADHAAGFENARDFAEEGIVIVEAGYGLDDDPVEAVGGKASAGGVSLERSARRGRPGAASARRARRSISGSLSTPIRRHGTRFAT